MSPSRPRLLVILGALSAFGPLTTDVYLPALPALARHFRTPVASVQLTLTACVLGLAIGQILVGPISDSLGRRRPLLVGLAVFTLASVACAVAPAVWVLDLGRLVQGLSGAAGLVISRAMVRDLYGGPDAARFFSTLGAVISVGPIIAPAIGGAILLVVAWPGVFAFRAAVGAVLFGAVLLGTRETLPRERRRPLALEGERARAGSASAVFGFLQFAAGAAVAPLVGVAGTSAVSMAVVMGAAGLIALGLHTTLLRGASAGHSA